MGYSSAAYSGRFSSLARDIKPFWTCNFEDEDEILKWAKLAFDALSDEHKAQTQQDLLNRDFYMGLHSASLGKEGIPRDKEGKPLQKFSRVVLNTCFELIEQWVSKMTRFAPAIAVIPPNQEYNDRIAAQMSKDFIDYIFYVNEIDDIDEQAARGCRIDGETFVLVRWDEAIGDLSPKQAEIDKLQASGIRVPILDEAGQPVVGDNGEPLYVEKKQRVGDVRYEVLERKYMLLDPKGKYADCNWGIIIKCDDIDELKAKYPEKADEIDKKTPRSSFVGELFEADKELNEILTFELVHRGTEFLDSGRYVKFIDGAVLENKTCKEKFGHEEFPWARLTNIDVPGLLRGVSFLENLKLLNVMYNNLASIGYTNLALGAHIYWMVPREGNIDVKKIRNGASVLMYSGVAPKMERFQCVGDEIFKMMEFVNEEMLRKAGIQGVSRGEPPQGIEAGVALAFLEEQENQRANTDIKKHNAFIKKLARLSLATAGAFYKPDDGRTIRIVGKNNQFSVKSLDVAKLGGPYDIRVQRTTALSESKAGRLSQILALEGRFPGKIPWEQVADMLDLANDKKFYSLATVSVEAQERENEMMAQGQPVPDAAEYEEHMVHWYSLRKHMQSASFKEDTPDEIKQLFIKHGMSHEMWMHIKSATNMVYKQTLMTQYPEFPVFTQGVGPTTPALIGSDPLAQLSAMENGQGGTESIPPAGPEAEPTDEMKPEPSNPGEAPVGGGPEPTAQPPAGPNEQPEAPVTGQ